MITKSGSFLNAMLTTTRHMAHLRGCSDEESAQWTLIEASKTGDRGGASTLISSRESAKWSHCAGQQKLA